MCNHCLNNVDVLEQACKEGILRADYMERHGESVGRLKFELRQIRAILNTALEDMEAMNDE